MLGLFAVESPSGRVSVLKPGLDYEQFTRYTVTVNSTDSGFPPYSVTDSFVITVKDLNEMPHNITISNSKVLTSALTALSLAEFKCTERNILVVSTLYVSCAG